MATVSAEELERIEALPSMAQLLPYMFENGSRLDNMVVSCSQCGGGVPMEHAHGEFAKYGESVSLSAHLLCYDCQIISPFEARIRDDGTLLIKTDGGWEEERYAPDESGMKGMFAGLRGFLKNIF